MTLEGIEIIARARISFPSNGRFSLLPEESINEVVDREKVPDARGVYVIFRSDELNRPLYIGRARTLETGSSWKEQGLKSHGWRVLRFWEHQIRADASRAVRKVFATLA